jgi:predicted O-methyltransferase YrrM
MPEGQRSSLGFLDVGCMPAQLEWIGRHVDFVRIPKHHFEFPANGGIPEYLQALFARPFLRDYFPGFEIYFWIDADAWVEDWRGVELMLRGAGRERLAIVPELDRGSLVQYGSLPEFWSFLHNHYRQAFGEEVAKSLCNFPVLNAGVFALHRRAPHWEPWAACLRDALQRSAGLLTDQMALNLVAYRHCFSQTELLPAWCNWTCHHAWPAWDIENARPVEPYLPHTPISILHLSGRAKPPTAQLRSTAGQTVEVNLRYPTALNDPGPATADQSSDRDYVSPGMVRVAPSACFPHKTVGDKGECPWPYLRRDVPHRWWVDRRSPITGFLNEDEVHILYNTALQFFGKRALEIGCWLGWSACHLALAGVHLDVIDPLLAEPNVRTSVAASLAAAGLPTTVNLVPGASPAAVRELAASMERKWSLFFIDGNHDHPAPLEDAIACAEYAEADAAILFHDLASPAVAEGLAYLKRQGWKTLVYMTMQIMGVAYRGTASPVAHAFDPDVNWSLPEHLREFAICGWRET